MSENLDLFRETPHFHKKYGYKASFDDLTKSSIDFLKGIEDKLTDGYQKLLRSDKVRAEKRKLSIKKDGKDNWNCLVSTAPFTARTMPYFPKKLGKLMKKGSNGFYDSVDDELVSFMEENWNMKGGTGTSRKERVESINHGTGRSGDKSDGYVIFPWEKVPKYFNKDLIEDVGKENFLGGQISPEALEKMCKDSEQVRKHYPAFRELPFRFHKKYSKSGRYEEKLHMYDVLAPKKWEMYL